MVCAVVVCDATPGTARVELAAVWPLPAAPASSTSAVPGVAAQITTEQTVWVVNFYSTTKTKQYTIISRDDHEDEPPCWNTLADNVIVMMKASIDTVVVVVILFPTEYNNTIECAWLT